jgi:ABC-type branched-subunit amino acid transport system substrate-binding protein
MNKRKKITSLAVGALLTLIVCTSVLAQEAPKSDNQSRTNEAIIIGSVVPSTGPLTLMGQAVKNVSTAFFTELNSQGGVNGRRIELKFIETGATPKATRANLEQFLRDEHIFAMTGAFIAGAENEILPLVQEQGVPLVGPMTLYPQTGTPLNRQVFYLTSGIEIQARAMIEFMTNSETLKTKKIGIVYANNERDLKVVDAVKDQVKKNGLNAIEVYPLATGTLDTAEMVKQLRAGNRDFVIFIGTADNAPLLLKEMEKASWFPHVYPVGGFTNAIFDLSIEFNDRILLTFPTSPVDQTAEGIAEYRTLAEKYKLTTQSQAAQISAYAAAKILVEGIKRSGKDLTREKLIQSLESLSNYSTGLAPLVTYGPNRRVGAQGAYVIKVDLVNKTLAPASGWNDVK